MAVIWPPNRPPLIVTVYYTGAKASGDQINALIADVGRLATQV